MNGADFLLLVNTGTPASPAYEAVGCQRDCTIEESSDSIDLSCKDSRNERVEPGRYHSTISLDSLIVLSDAAYAALKAANRAGDMILVAREIEDVVTETANCKIDSLSESYPDQAEAVVACALTVSDGWVEVGS